MFPNATMMKPQTWSDVLGDDDRRAQRARLELKRSRTHGEERSCNIGLVGYGFMGRTHSNAFLQAPRFFDLPYEPVLKAVCARNADRVEGVCRQLGLRVDRDRLARAGRAQGHRPDRYRQPQRHARRDRHRRRAAPARWCSAKNRSGARRPKRSAMVEAVEAAQACRTWSGTTTAAFRLSCC